MAQPRKAVAEKPGAGGSARPKANPPASAKAAPAAAQSSAQWLRVTLTIFALFCLIGAIPTALGGEAFGYWRLPITGVQLAAPPWSLSYDAPLATPKAMIANATLRIVSAPGGATAYALLEPGFPAQVTRYATRAGVRWAQIRWSGPTRAAGGSGWTLASGLIAANGANSASQARPIGDMGALSPTFGRVTSTLGASFASALYFPSTGATYHTTSPDQAAPLNGQIVPLVLTALYATGKVAAQPNATAGPPAIVRDLASGNAQALTFDYQLVGDAQGLSDFFAQYHITGFQFTAHQPTQASGTARALGLFYMALEDGALVNQHDRDQIVSLLAGAYTSGATAIAPQSVIGSGALVVTTDSAGGGVVSIASGILTPASGPAVVVVAIAHGATNADAQKIVQTYFGDLISIMQG